MIEIRKADPKLYVITCVTNSSCYGDSCRPTVVDFDQSGKAVLPAVANKVTGNTRNA
jgi:hypothetical protein